MFPLDARLLFAARIVRLFAYGFVAVSSYRSAIIAYAILGGILAIVFARVSPAIEGERVAKTTRGLFRVERSRSVVTRLSALFAVDAFAGGLVVQSIVAYWFFRRFGLRPAALGSPFFGATLAAGASAPP